MPASIASRTASLLGSSGSESPSTAAVVNADVPQAHRTGVDDEGSDVGSAGLARFAGEDESSGLGERLRGHL